MDWLWPAVILVSTALAILSAAELLPEPIRVAGMFWFLLVCPGLAYVPLFNFGPPAIELLIALGASFAMNTLLTTALMLMNAWSMQSALLIMIGITMLGVLLQLAQHWPAMRRRLR
jgi:hypothetical protein